MGVILSVEKLESSFRAASAQLLSPYVRYAATNADAGAVSPLIFKEYHNLRVQAQVESATSGIRRQCFHPPLFAAAYAHRSL